jgi:TolB-like protein
MKNIKFLLLIFLFSLCYSQEKKNIAVIDLDVREGISRGEAGTLTDRLRSMLVKTNAFIVVERDKMENILTEVGFQQTGCVSTECAVEVGKILNVQQMVTGSIGKVGTLYTLDIRLVDVETSKIVRSVTRNYRGEIEGLVGLMDEIANQLIETKPGSYRWLWIGGGAVVATAGAVVVFNLISGKTTSEKPIPPPELPPESH